MAGHSKKFFWMDLEMTGLDEKKDHILEVAAIVTGVDLKPLESLHRVVFQPQSVLDGMNDWCKENHGKSGLTADVPKGTPIDQVEKELISLVERHYPKDERVVICGNSIGNDRRFIDQYWQNLSKRLHYRMIDVSSFKEVYRDRYGIQFKKKNGHRALDDIHESIRELDHYLSFVNPKAGEKT
ncbi:MAG: oligoribonuclease [Bdellovibrionales bacterium]|nr:oligoribonuclease [Bdellovibrionales bacterium]